MISLQYVTCFTFLSALRSTAFKHLQVNQSYHSEGKIQLFEEATIIDTF